MDDEEIPGQPRRDAPGARPALSHRRAAAPSSGVSPLAETSDPGSSADPPALPTGLLDEALERVVERRRLREISGLISAIRSETRALPWLFASQS